MFIDNFGEDTLHLSEGNIRSNITYYFLYMSEA